MQALYCRPNQSLRDAEHMIGLTCCAVDACPWRHVRTSLYGGLYSVI
jgi:hypothetical protein